MTLIGIIVVILLIISLYMGIISLLIFLLSLIPILNITINSWFSLFAFSLCIIIWVIPYILITIFQAIKISNIFIKRLIRILSELINIILFTLYFLFLDKYFVDLSFSNSAVIIVIITILILTAIVNVAGKRLKYVEKKLWLRNRSTLLF